MIDVNKLRGIMAERRVSQSGLAHELGITPKTFYEKMKKGVFGSDEIQIMIDVLKINDPMAIFFAKE